MVVLLDGGTEKILDLFLFDGSDEDEDDGKADQKGSLTGSGDLRCLRECVS